ncbi:MAG: GBS Bsp-like repeat-containing protein [bacterium]|nr:GBS Bsp-like repeat-containing protein [bacterium]
MNLSLPKKVTGIVIAFFLVVPSFASALTINDLRAQVDELKTQVDELLVRIDEVQFTQSSTNQSVTPEELVELFIGAGIIEGDKAESARILLQVQSSKTASVETVSFTTSTVVRAPSNLTVSRTSQGLYGDANLISWQNNANYVTVEGTVTHRTSPSSPGISGGFDVLGSRQSYIHDGSTAPGTYTYKVRGTGLPGGPVSDWSDTVTITVGNDVVVPPPSNVVSCNTSHPSGGAGSDNLTTSATQGSYKVYAYGVQNAAKVLFPTWSDVEVYGRKQDDIVWYEGVKVPGSNGTWTASINLARHRQGNPDTGPIRVHVWMYGSDGTPVFCDNADFTRVNPSVEAGVGAGLLNGVSDVFNFIFETFPVDNPITNPPAVKFAQRVMLPGEAVSAGVIGSIRYAVRDISLMMQGL